MSRESDGVFVRLDNDLVRRSRAYARAHNLTLAQVINRSLKGMLAMVEQG